MKSYIQAEEWNIIEEGFDPHLNKISESIFSIGNGRMGQRANFEESYSGETLQGNYVAGVYYPDKTRVGWWKNGYPEYFAKVLNAADWMCLELKVDDEIVDLSLCKVTAFKRVLNMKAGYLERSFTAELASGKQIKVISKRFFSIANDEVAALHYQLVALNFSAKLTISSFIDGDVKNQDSNYDEKFWDEVSKTQNESGSFLTMRTKKTAFEVTTGVKTVVLHNGTALALAQNEANKEKYLGESASIAIAENSTVDIYKYATNLSSQIYDTAELLTTAVNVINAAVEKGFEVLLEEQAAAWAAKWEEGDIIIEGDVSAQQAIRFNIFQLNQTYTGKDARLNIGPKGFTGEKYGGSTYWDTEAYCIPFYLSTAPQEVSRNLLIYRYKHLQKAIENAEKLGFNKGAALYPMVTMNGEECHNEWEITFEEIHRNGAIAFAIFNYIRYTGDQSYLKEFGLEVLIGIARFWKQRVNWSADKKQFVMLGVTGPNEYENNVNNNWYTNTLAAWCLSYAVEAAGIVKAEDAVQYQVIIEKTALDELTEFADWTAVAENIYLPYDEEQGVFLQQDGFLDKEQILVKDLPATERPLNQKWSWDRILRSGFIKQADVLQGMYFFEDNYDLESLRRNFDFYESRTVHESSLSPCVHSILAAKLNDGERAYEFYLRTARLDLDDYNNDTEDGLHITSMAGTWMSIVEGFAGMRVRDGHLSFNPFLPEQWNSFSFIIGFRGVQLRIKIRKEEMAIINPAKELLDINIFNKSYSIPEGETVIAYKGLLV
ncbi:family 65 glycosyl hydrolase domain-containing protein [Pedobacter sp. MR2016-24]|uniref:family 65 glycosyl hydrolase domain-containing protein n=1 Tax=Pedobacter sp. MR2016-24 TaxID=2994466 RepID=UPI002246C891|nr:family 65 glycosyl hydrolase domain-containing protein [Pedobacter sp. MR2016-24]MCX2482417.1 family 65 glycosyl hydrolase domain-containing protein [Pedobacter sp. MR2016-24]